MPNKRFQSRYCTKLGTRAIKKMRKGAETLASWASHVGVPNLNSFLHVNVAYMLAALVKTLLRLLLKVKFSES